MCGLSVLSLVCVYFQFLALPTQMAAGKLPWTPPTPEVSAVVQKAAVKVVVHRSDKCF